MVNLDILPPILTKDERKQIYENWTDESPSILAERNMRLAVKIANSFQNTGIEDEELVCIAMLGLVKAAQKFDPELGNEFTTFAVPVIKNEILIAVRKNRRNKYIAVSLNAPIGCEEDSFGEYGDLIADSFNLEEYALTTDLNRIVQDLLSKENEQNRKICIAFMNGKTQEKISESYGVSQAQVSRIIKRFKKTVMEEWRG